MDTSSFSDSLEQNLLPSLEDSVDLEMADSNENSTEDSEFILGSVEVDDENDDIIVLHMDIREPLSTLKTLLENKVDLKLNKYEFWLQDAQMLECHKNLVDQCVKGEGLVQINVQIQTTSKRINVVDVLKPTDDVLAASSSASTEIKSRKRKILEDNENSVSSEWDDEHITFGEEADEDNYDQVVNWILDIKYKKEQSRLRIPDDPKQWTTTQVKHWLQWAVRQFNLSQIKLSDWDLTGEELCRLTLEDFHRKVPHDPGNVFWTHFELLRKCKFVAIIQKASGSNTSDGPKILRKNHKIPVTSKIPVTPVTNIIRNYDLANLDQWETLRGRSGNNGQIQLWQFLLDILTDKAHRNIIQWNNGNGEFKLIDPELVAVLWGERKNKPAMNYEKLSRALRYYYNGDMISKVHGQRFVYKFVCDLKQLIGYDVNELANLVNECQQTEYSD